MSNLSNEQKLAAVRRYADAKCRHDADAALADCDDNFVLDVPTLGVRFEGAAAVRHQLNEFFSTFPDYGAIVEGQVVGEDAVVFWCTEHGTMRGPLLGLNPTGQRAAFPTASIYTFREGRLAGERWFFSLASMCGQLGLSLDAVVSARDSLLRAMPELSAVPSAG